MSDVQGIILHNILKDPTSSLEIWPKLKVYFFNADYSHIYLAISKHYNKYQKLPSFEELKITTRDMSLVQKVRALELLSVPEDIDNEIALEALTDQYTQDEALEHILGFLDKLPKYDTADVKLKFAEILQDLEEKTDTAEDIILMSDIMTMDEEEIHSKVILGLNNQWDAQTGGVSLTELIMIGGHRGSGKTITACNVVTKQYEHGDIGLIFTIEMRHREIYNRIISILAEVNNNRLKRGKCTPDELERVARVKSDFFVDSEEVYQDYLKHKDFQKFEVGLISSKSLKPDNQTIIVDNQYLTMADIDMNISKFKLRFGKKLKVVVVDYVNQIQIKDIYDWKSQVMLSKGLKSLARKHEVVMVTPYQTDKSGEARFSKGLLDAPDISAELKGHDTYINIKSTKTRDYKPFEFNAPIDWETFRMYPQDAIIETDDSKKDSEGADDVPWM